MFLGVLTEQADHADPRRPGCSCAPLLVWMLCCPTWYDTDLTSLPSGQGLLRYKALSAMLQA
jgi:hypothetical protein